MMDTTHRGTGERKGVVDEASCSLSSARSRRSRYTHTFSVGRKEMIGHECPDIHTKNTTE